MTQHISDKIICMILHRDNAFKTEHHYTNGAIHLFTPYSVLMPCFRVLQTTLFYSDAVYSFTRNHRSWLIVFLLYTTDKT
eukprot:UN21064